MLLGAALLRACDLKVLSPNRELLRGGRSLGTTRPPAVTRMPGGLPCSLRSLSALPRLTDGDGDGFLLGAAGAILGVVWKGFSEETPIRFADTEGRKTCSEKKTVLVL